MNDNFNKKNKDSDKFEKWLRIPPELVQRMKKQPQMNWSAVANNAFEEVLNELEKGIKLEKSTT